MICSDCKIQINIQEGYSEEDYTTCFPNFEFFCYKCRMKPRCVKCGDPDFEARTSLGIYAGRYCDDCWKVSGYRKEGKEGFDPMDAGESYEAEDY